MSRTVGGSQDHPFSQQGRGGGGGCLCAEIQGGKGVGKSACFGLRTNQQILRITSTPAGGVGYRALSDTHSIVFSLSFTFFCQSIIPEEE